MNFRGAFLACPSCASSEKSHVLVVKVPGNVALMSEQGLTNSGVRSSAARHWASSTRPRRQRPSQSQCLRERSQKPSTEHGDMGQRSRRHRKYARIWHDWRHRTDLTDPPVQRKGQRWCDRQVFRTAVVRCRGNGNEAQMRRQASNRKDPFRLPAAPRLAGIVAAAGPLTGAVSAYSAR
jgi:hypothetical protein